MDATLRDTLNEIRELRTERYAAKFAHDVDRDDAEAASRYREVEAKLAAFDLPTLLAAVKADHERHVSEYDAAVLLLTLRPTEARSIDVAQGQIRKNLERYGLGHTDEDVRRIRDEGADPVSVEIEGVHYRRRPPQSVPPGPPPLSPEEIDPV